MSNGSYKTGAFSGTGPVISGTLGGLQDKYTADAERGISINAAYCSNNYGDYGEVRPMYESCLFLIKY